MSLERNMAKQLFQDSREKGAAGIQLTGKSARETQDAEYALPPGPELLEPSKWNWVDMCQNIFRKLQKLVIRL